MLILTVPVDRTNFLRPVQAYHFSATGICKKFLPVFFIGHMTRAIVKLDVQQQQAVVVVFNQGLVEAENV
jgi:hypothetical protein